MSTKNRIVALIGLLLVVVSFLAGFWPERQRRTALDLENAGLRARVEALDDHQRLAKLHGQMLNVIEAIASMNYGEAQSAASLLFNNVRAEVSRTRNGEYRAVLDEVLATRDEVTSLLAKGDPTAVEPLHRSERQLRQVLAKPTITSP